MENPVRDSPDVVAEFKSSDSSHHSDKSEEIEENTNKKKPKIDYSSEVQENGQGSAVDIVRRKKLRQISESEVGMFDMFVQIPEVTNHPKIKIKTTAIPGTINR